MALRLEQQGQERRHPRLSIRRVLAGRHPHHRVLEEHLGLLTEVASARLATPVRVEPGSWPAAPRASSSTARSQLPNPWPGGWWRLARHHGYERIISDALLETAATYRRDFLRDAVSARAGGRGVR
jgi:hypothetical protein